MVARDSADGDEATFIFTSETLKTIDVGQGAVETVFVYRGFLVYDNRAHPLHLANQDCHGTAIRFDDTKFAAGGYATTLLTSGGGGIWVAWDGDHTGGTWAIRRGLGTLEKATGSGTFGPRQGSWPDGKAYHRIKGRVVVP